MTLSACEGGAGGPATDSAVVARVIDGDTVELEGGERVRYLMVDTPEITSGKHDCFGEEAKALNDDLVTGKTIELSYDVERTDRYGRTLAYVSVDGREVNTILVKRGYACVLYIPPNGEDREIEFLTLQARAMKEGRGMWGTCAEVACAN
ncbi:MAG TPA: thermonuclease family protein [Kofleriaceae bacterium]|nr:thermonuclease family protein [Kofleriaceae bacterium]